MLVTYIPTSMNPIDPRYQYLLAQRNSGAGEPRFISANEGFVPIFAKITSLQSWKNLTEVQLGIEIQRIHDWIVTARIPFSRFEALRHLPFVSSMKIASPVVQPLLQATLKEIGLSPSVKIPGPVLAQGGKHVVVGIVDFGCDFNHKNFIKASLKTRIHSIWEQSGKSTPNSPYGYGRVYTRAEINDSLSKPDPYNALGYRPKKRAHGTHVMDIATGNGTTPGVAPRAKIIFVELALEQDKKLADSVCAVEAVKYIFDQAGDRPCVVNLSLGQNGGAHDGTGLVEQALDALIQEKPNRAIVIAGGNSYTDKSHISGTVASGKYVDIQWDIKPLDPTDNELEIWYSGKDEFEVEIYYKNVNAIARLPLNTNGFLTINKNGKDVKLAYASHRKNDPYNGDNVFQMFQDPTCDVSGGIWTLRLHGKNIAATGNFHAWIERDDAGPSTFVNDDPNYTIGSISTGHKTIVVGSYDAHRANTPISYFSSAGPTRDGRNKPELSAPGHDVWAADSTSTNGMVKMSGTSMAAPAVSGLIARVLGHVHMNKVKINIDQIRDAVISTARKNPPSDPVWDRRYGFGRLNAETLLTFSTSYAPAAAAEKNPASKFAGSGINPSPPAPTFQRIPPTIPRPAHFVTFEWLKKNLAVTTNTQNPYNYFHMGLCYYFGQGTEVKYQEAAIHFRYAADLSHAEAQYCLAICYLLGHGVSIDRVEAYKLVEQAYRRYPLAEMVKRQLEQYP